ncbi:MAG: lysylphosphatidylglycerol synthase transmembrane domain-containing protein [Halobacteriota archaeon]
MFSQYKNKILDQKQVIFILFSLAVLAVIIVHSGISNLISGIKQIDYTLILPMYLILFSSFVVKVLRWGVILQGIGLDFKFRKLLKIFLGIFFVNQFSPQIGSELYRAYALHKDNKQSFGTNSASVFYDRLLDSISLLVIVIPLLVYSLGGFVFNKYSIVLISLSILFLMMILITLKPDLGLKLAYFFTKCVNYLPDKISSKINKKIDKNLEPFFNATNVLKESRKTLSLGIILSFLAWGMSYIQTYVIFMSINVSLDPLVVAIIYFIPLAISSFIFIMPKGPASDLTIYGVCLLYGLSPEISGLYVIIRKLIAVSFSITVGWFCFTHVGVKTGVNE